MILTAELDLYGIAITFRVDFREINSANCFPEIISSFKAKLMKQKILRCATSSSLCVTQNDYVIVPSTSLLFDSSMILFCSFFFCLQSYEKRYLTFITIY